MGLNNASNLLRTQDLKPLFAFVQKFCDGANLALVTVVDCPREDSTGRPGYGGEALPDRARIFVDARATYPRTQQMTKRTPVVAYSCWQDEFVLVLAHELRHVDQFAIGAFGNGQELEAEVDAETFAAAVLIRFQQESAVKAA
jgi:hypothetical protein